MHDKVGLGNLAGLLLKLGGGYISSIILNLCIINLPLYIKGRVGQVGRSFMVYIFDFFELSSIYLRGDNADNEIR